MGLFIRAISTACLAFLACLAWAAPALAEIEQLAVPPGNDWEHQWTDMVFPAKIDGFERERVMQFEDRQTNVSARYLDYNSGTILSLYIYRPYLADAPIWFDRALMAIGQSNHPLGQANMDAMRIGSFVPSGGTVESGQYAVLKLEGDFRSTAVAMYQAGDWLVKVRISSQKLSERKMENLTLEVLSGLPALADLSQSPAYLIEQCADNLKFSQAIAFHDP